MSSNQLEVHPGVRSLAFPPSKFSFVAVTAGPL
jgi:hypothetical protein